MKIAYGDLIGGVSGDMFAAALLGLGLPLNKLKAELKKIPTLRFDLKLTTKTVHAVRARHFKVLSPDREPRRAWKEIRALIERSKLAPEVQKIGIDIFAALARAEARIHGVAVEDVHFHEIGATDSIVDVMAAAVGIHELGIASFHFSPVPLGRGLIHSRHGLLPAPGPATLELLKGLPVFGVDVEGETVTPTGAAILRALGTTFGEPPSMIVEKIGYGAGQKALGGRPNLFRLILGENAQAPQRDEMLVIETNIDDMNPQLYDHVMDRLFAAGARDVFLAPVQMKKNRPAIVLTVICEPPLRDRMAEILFRETSTIGIRFHAVSRLTLKRETKKIKTRFGEVTVKVVEEPDGRKRATPEYDDLKRIALKKKLPVKRIHDEVMRLVGK
ncbi:MAG TPA: nickel pincer cofactor biosynthesis protein LarC [Candidatus Binatia bacterium]|nr:nickel pincer cofactor biosynthesis protein LarC [Candidatus Binatia bacterium]